MNSLFSFKSSPSYLASTYKVVLASISYFFFNWFLSAFYANPISPGDSRHFPKQSFAPRGSASLFLVFPGSRKVDFPRSKTFANYAYIPTDCIPSCHRWVKWGGCNNNGNCVQCFRGQYQDGTGKSECKASASEHTRGWRVGGEGTNRPAWICRAAFWPHTWPCMSP